MMRRELGNKLIPRPQGQMLFYKDGDTADIATKVMKVFSEQRHQVAALAPHLVGPTLQDTCRNIWRIVKDNIRYQTDPKNNQWVRRPAQMWWSGVGDCKSYSVFIASCLDALGIAGSFRFVSYDKGPPTHVYVVVKNNGSEIILDAVMPGFDQQKPYKYKLDYNMTRIYELSGIRQQTRVNPQIAGGLSTLVLGKQRREVLTEALPGLAILAIYQFIPSGNGNEFTKAMPSFATSDNLLSRLPPIIKDKQYKSFQSFWDFGDWAGIKVENEVFPKLRTLLTAQLGMDPQDWWRKVLSTGSYSSITGAEEDAAAQAAGGSAEGQAIEAMLKKVKGIVNGLFGGTDIKWKRGDPATWGAAYSDWDGYPFNPLNQIPIGSPTDPRPVNMTPVSNPTPVNNQPYTPQPQPYTPPPANYNQPPLPPAPADSGNSSTGLIIAAVVVVGILAFKGK